jgi:predicted phosphodiesterase
VENETLLKVFKLDKPDYVFSGHDHRTPFVGSPFVKMGSTLCLNPGSPPKLRKLSEPPHIIVDTLKRTVVWQWGTKQLVSK